jgi:alcohol dehydrogenase (cytochrome c)
MMNRKAVLAVAFALVMSVASLIGSAQVADFKPLTDAMLLNPDPDDWINWRRTLDGWGFSPLKQINKDNVDQIQLVWARTMGAGLSEPTPLVYNGVMYVPSALGLIQALDAVTGELLWDYTKRIESPTNFRGWVPRMRSLAIYGNNIYMTTAEAHIVALDARTGKVVWDTTVADYKLGYRYTSGPIVAKGRIIAGITGCEFYKNDVCFISAYDPLTGKELWRTSTIARPGEPGGDTWGDLPLSFRAGGDAWIPGSYDAKTNLIYWSVAQAKPWARVSRGTDGDALYTNSTLALDPETGKIVWYHQRVPGESHDLDDAYENVLIDYDGRSSVFEMGKLGILWEVDRKTGAFVAAHDLGYQTVVEVDPQTGQVRYQRGMIPQSGVPLEWCPGMVGVRNWRATAYHPDTHALYIPMTDLSCVRGVLGDVEKKEGVGGYSPIPGYKSLGSRPHPGSPKHRGGFTAMDIRNGNVLWKHPTRLPMTAAALTTAGGLAIVGDADRYLYVHDATSGKILFQMRLPHPVQGFPVTYAVRGRQYLAIPTSSGSLGSQESTGAGNVVFVFALPERALRLAR